MNAEEGVSLAKMAVTVLLVVLIIGAVVAIVYAAYSWFTRGTSTLTDQVTSIDKSQFSQYDNQRVTGTDVLSCLKTYRESEICIVVGNLTAQGAGTPVAYNNATTSFPSLPNYCALTADAWTPGNTTPNIPVGTNNSPATPVSRSATGTWYIGSSADTGSNGLSWDPTTNNLQRNTNFSVTTTNSDTYCYVKQSANWYAQLLYDPTTNDICGILFLQMN